MLVEGPPAEFTLKASTDLARGLVEANYPDLLDLVEDGTPHSSAYEELCFSDG